MMGPAWIIFFLGEKKKLHDFEQINHLSRWVKVNEDIYNETSGS